MEDARVVTAPGRYRLRTHELAQVIQPRSRAASSSVVTNREDFCAVSPTRPRGSIARAITPPRGRTVLESIAFDPFSNSESFKFLLQDPEESRERRKDPKAVAEFRQWQSRHFPQLLRTFQALHLICKEQEPSDPQEEFDNSQAEEADEEAWRLIFQQATVMSATPGEKITIESITRTESVYFLLNGHCQLSFRPFLLRDSKTQSPATHLRELVAGDCFGLDAAAFGFEYSLSTATADSARQRNVLGLREVALTHVLCLPYAVVQQLQHRHQDNNIHLSPTFPFAFAPEAEVFLRNTFLFRSMADSSRRFLAAHMTLRMIAQQEYLFTPGQPVRVFIVKSGQLTLGSPREDRHGRTEAELELELLQAYDSVGLAETLHLETSFDRYCAVTSANGARAYELPSTVLLMVLAQESSTLKILHEWIAHRKSWYELRRATALAQRKRFTGEGSEHVVRLTSVAQRRSKLTCSRCGWTGHASTSSSCVRVDIPVSESPALPMLQLDKRKSRGSRAAREQARKAERLRSTSIPESDDTTPGQQQHFSFSFSPTSPRKTPAHRRLQVNSIVLRGLQISRISMMERLQSDTPASSETNTDVEDHRNVINTSSKEDALRSCKLTQSLRRLEIALQH
ncbi:hypothetical protein DVH05_007874 [Phytophthora capsici]|nr:hypothetical protein DVH05_007874 [Phytophthora capsici]|eukprot:jgi/Phyca11/557900/estExt2_Genewise1.C_PHYCAscaffold_10061